LQASTLPKESNGGGWKEKRAKKKRMTTQLPRSKWIQEKGETREDRAKDPGI